MLGSIAAFPLLGVSFVLGLKHALDGDHIVAVSTVVAENRGVMRTSLVGTFWGIGHTLALMFVGMAVLVFDVEISPKVASFAELFVAMMLIFLGFDLLRKMRGEIFSNNSACAVQSTQQYMRKPFLIGVVHGLAGSAALMVMVVATMQSIVDGLLHVAVFGLGTIGGMCTMSIVMGLPFALGRESLKTFVSSIKVLAGVASVAFGLVLGWTVGQTIGFWA